MINDDIFGLFFSFISFLCVGRVLGPVGGPGGSEFLSLVLPKGVDIRNIHLDGIQARHQGSSCVYISVPYRSVLILIRWIRIQEGKTTRKNKK
jgi:hypothetical protein